VPTVVLLGGAMLSGLYWITQRRAEVALAEGQANNTGSSHNARSLQDRSMQDKERS